MVLSAEHCWIREPEVPTLLDRFHFRPLRQQFKCIEMMFGTSNKAVDIYGPQIRSVDGKFTLEAEVNKVDRKELLTLENPKCAEIVAQFSHLKGVTTNDNDEKHSMKRQI